MEKDLRDAYKALKLMHADLARTKKEKQALEHQFTLYMQQHEAQQQQQQQHNNNTDKFDSEMTAATKAEHALMRHEDAQAQLLQLQKEHATLKEEHAALEQAHEALKNEVRGVSNQPARDEDQERDEPSDTVSYAKKDTASAFEHCNDAERGNQDQESEFAVETEPIGSNNDEDESQDLHQHQQKHQQKQKQLPQEETAIVEEMVREKLGLLANLYTLKTKMDEQTSEMLEQQANFVHERDELCMQLEELSEQMVALQSHVMDVENEKQFIEEKYDFLITELDLMKKERAESIGQGVVNPETLELQQEGDASEDRESDELGDDVDQVSPEQQQRDCGGDEGEDDRVNERIENDRDAVESKLRELEATREQLESERSVLRLQREQRHDEKSEGDVSRAKEMLEREIEALKRDRESLSSQHAQKLEGLSRSNLILQQELQEKEIELAALKNEMKKQAALSGEELVAAVQDRERVSEELRSALKEMETREAELIQDRDNALQEAQAEHEDQVSAVESRSREQQEAHDALLERIEQQQAASASEREKLSRRVLETDERLASLHSEMSSIQEQTSALEQELSEKNEVIVRLESEKQRSVQQVRETRDQLAHDIEALKQSHEAQSKTNEDEFQARLAESWTSQKAQHDKALKASAMEVKALLQETRQLKQLLKQKEDELAQLRSMADAKNAELIATKEEHERVNLLATETRDLLQYQLSVLETQLMEIEDKKRVEEDEFDDLAVVDDSDKNARAWTFIKQKVRELDRFLPQLQSFAYFLDTTLCFCEANTSTLEALSIQNSGGGNLTQDIVSFLRFVSQLQRGVGATSHVKQGRRLHRQVLELLSNWYECSEKDDIPAPPFGIASREASLVLHNWSGDKSKRVAAKRWLKRMETVTGQTSSEEEANLAIEGSTLELQQMTMEVKQAFLMLIIPILKRNSAIYVRVFTRKALVSNSGATPSSSVVEGGEDMSWEMKIHVQLADTLLRRRSSSPQFRPRPPPLKLSDSLPATRFEDHLVARTPTSAQKLQIIQERLQSMQQK